MYLCLNLGLKSFSYWNCLSVKILMLWASKYFIFNCLQGSLLSFNTNMTYSESRNLFNFLNTNGSIMRLIKSRLTTSGRMTWTVHTTSISNYALLLTPFSVFRENIVFIVKLSCLFWILLVILWVCQILIALN